MGGEEREYALFIHGSRTVRSSNTIFMGRVSQRGVASHAFVDSFDSQRYAKAHGIVHARDRSRLTTNVVVFRITLQSRNLFQAAAHSQPGPYTNIQ